MHRSLSCPAVRQAPCLPPALPTPPFRDCGASPALPCAPQSGATTAVTTALIAILAILALGGCAGYTLGPTNGLAAGEKSIQIRPFANQTFEPRLTDTVAQQLRKQVQSDGTYQLSTHGDPDIILTGVITHFTRTEVTFVSSDVLTVQDYRLTLTAQITMRERSTGKVLLDQPVNGYTLVRVGNDLTSAERQALPLLAGDLAKNAVALLAEGKW